MPFYICLLGFTLALQGCQKKNDSVCGADSGINLDFGCCIAWEDSGLLLDHRDSIEASIRDALVLVNLAMPIRDVRIRIVTDPSNAIPEIGLGGFNPGPNEIIISFDPQFPELKNSIRMELAPMVAHELHHARRRRAVGYGSTLLEACISEGLADWFSIEIMKIPPPPWSVKLTGPTLDQFIQMASITWTEQGYNHGSWFFGTTQNIPRWTGYSIGYELVKNYLLTHPDRKSSNLFNEPAVSFKP